MRQAVFTGRRQNVSYPPKGDVQIRTDLSILEGTDVTVTVNKKRQTRIIQ